jgi:hypothetical protein
MRSQQRRRQQLWIVRNELRRGIDLHRRIVSRLFSRGRVRDVSLRDVPHRLHVLHRHPRIERSVLRRGIDVHLK